MSRLASLPPFTALEIEGADTASTRIIFRLTIVYSVHLRGKSAI
jgi:hypothetical protein